MPEIALCDSLRSHWNVCIIRNRDPGGKSEYVLSDYLPYRLSERTMKILLRCFQGAPRAVLTFACIFTAVIALVDWWVVGNIYFGTLYVFPMLLAGTVLPRWQIPLAAIFCTVLGELFDPFPFELITTLSQDILLFIALAGMGLYSREITVTHQQELENRQRIEKEVAARREAEEQLEIIIKSSPVAILVMNASGEILIGNPTAHHLFRVGTGELVGRNISRYVPALGRVPSVENTSQTFRTEMQCRGKRDNEEIFLANVFFSTYSTAMGPRLAALVVDASEDLRDRAEYGLEQLMAGSRVLVGAVSHEVRNVCSAIAVIYQNLGRNGGLAENPDFGALGSLVEALNKIASLELRQSTGGFEARIVDLTELLDEARIVLEPYCAESDITVNWNIPEKLPCVWADRHGLLQVLLNLTKNSRRALEGAGLKRIDVSVAVECGIVSIRVADTGPGVASTEKLFQPLQKGAEATGLGLFLSRAFMRSLRGDLRYDPEAPGSCFVIELVIADIAEADHG
jgi:two-component system sensor kinase FixL